MAIKEKISKTSRVSITKDQIQMGLQILVEEHEPNYSFFKEVIDTYRIIYGLDRFSINLITKYMERQEELNNHISRA